MSVYDAPGVAYLDPPMHYNTVHCDPFVIIWLLIELELRFEIQRVASHKVRPTILKFKVLSQPLTFEVRPMTRNSFTRVFARKCFLSNLEL